MSFQERPPGVSQRRIVTVTTNSLRPQMKFFGFSPVCPTPGPGAPPETPARSGIMAHQRPRGGTLHATDRAEIARLVGQPVPAHAGRADALDRLDRRLPLGGERRDDPGRDRRPGPGPDPGSGQPDRPPADGP